MNGLSGGAWTKLLGGKFETLRDLRNVMTYFQNLGGAINIFLRDLYENISKYPRTKNEELSMNIIFALVRDWAQT